LCGRGRILISCRIRTLPVLEFNSRLFTDTLDLRPHSPFGLEKTSIVSGQFFRYRLEGRIRISKLSRNLPTRAHHAPGFIVWVVPDVETCSRSHTSARTTSR